MKEYEPKECPDLRACDSLVTDDYFTRICSTVNFKNCHFLSKRNNWLKTPIDWVKKKAIELEDGKQEPDEQESFHYAEHFRT